MPEVDAERVMLEGRKVAAWVGQKAWEVALLEADRRIKKTSSKEKGGRLCRYSAWVNQGEPGALLLEDVILIPDKTSETITAWMVGAARRRLQFLLVLIRWGYYDPRTEAPVPDLSRLPNDAVDHLLVRSILRG